MEVFMSTLTIRGIDQELSQKIKEIAQQNNESINQSVLKILKTALGLTKPKQFKSYNDLDHLAGGWTVKDEKSIYEATSDFRKIDKELWMQLNEKYTKQLNEL